MTALRYLGRAYLAIGAVLLAVVLAAHAPAGFNR